MPASPEVITFPAALFGGICAIASSAFTAGGVYATLVGRIGRLEKSQVETESDVKLLQAQTQDINGKLIALQIDVGHIGRTVAAIAEKMGVVPR